MLMVFLALSAPLVTPYPKHSTSFANFAEASLPPSARHWFGTDTIGRDILTRTVLGFRVLLALRAVVLALAVLGFLQPNLFNAMMVVTVIWWPWYTRLVYNLARSICTEGFVTAEVVGASKAHILFREILPNCAPSILTKMTLDMGFVILIGSSLSFLGLGVQPPTPDLGSMVAEGAKYLPDQWWISVFPGLAVLICVLGFNLLGDGLRDLLDVEV